MSYTLSHKFDRFYISVLSFKLGLSFCFSSSLIPLFLPCCINLSLLMSPSWLSFLLMLSFSLRKFCFSLITSVNSSWLISESISALDIIFSIVFNLLKAKKEFFYIYFYLFFKFILLYTFYLVCIFIIYIHSYLMSSFWFIPIKIYCVSPSLRVFGK